MRAMNINLIPVHHSVSAPVADNLATLSISLLALAMSYHCKWTNLLSIVAHLF